MGDGIRIGLRRDHRLELKVRPASALQGKVLYCPYYILTINKLILRYMYIRPVIVLILLLAAELTLAQKPVIDTLAYGKFPGFGNACLNNDGEYVCYESYDKTSYGVVIKGTHNAWEKEITNVKSMVSFANDGHLLITEQEQDSLCLQTLGSDQQEVIPHVSSFKVSKNGKAEYLIYQLSNPDNELVVRNLASGKEQAFSNVAGYQFSSGDRAIVLQKQANGSASSLGWLDLNKGALNTIWQGKSTGDFSFSSDGKAVAFIGSSDVSVNNALWYYKTGDENARMLATENPTDGSIQGLKFGHIVSFNSIGDKLFFTLEQNVTVQKPNVGLASVDVYSYKDPKLQSQQLKELHSGQMYTYVYILSTGKIIALEQEHEHLIGGIDDLHKQDFVLILKDNGGDAVGEWNWNPGALSSVYLVSTINGTRKCLCKNKPIPVSSSYQRSPDDKYVVYYDAGLHDYFSYDIAIGVTRNITKGVSVNWTSESGEDLPDSIYEVASHRRIRRFLSVAKMIFTRRIRQANWLS
jgi:hypothetical protein